MLKILKIQGNSLFPEYQDGDFVITTKIPVFLDRLKKDQLVAFDHDLYGRIIKRISEIDKGSRRIFVIGDHEESLDSRQLGWIDYHKVIGAVIGHISRPG